MNILRTGDKCPFCGQPIKTEDPDKLLFLSAIDWFDKKYADTLTPGAMCAGEEE